MFRTRFAAIAATLFAATSAGADVARCLERAPGGERGTCLAAELPTDGRSLLQELEQLLARDPAAVLDALASGAGRGIAAIEPARLDLEAAAQTKLGRSDLAADALARAVALEDGTTRLTWFAPGGSTRWSSALDAGSGRLERAGRALLAAGRKEAARPMIARAIALGAQGLEDAWAEAGGGPVPGVDAERAALDAVFWRDVLPEASVPIVGAEPVSLRELRGRVVVLSFWATWCEPCTRELPHLGALYAALADVGLTVLAVNYQEAPDVALGFVDSLGMKLPVGLCTLELQRAFRLEKVPTMVVADRQGRVRARWEGYTEGMEVQVTTLVNELIAESSEPPLVLGEVSKGAGTMTASWMRQGQVPIAGVFAVPAAGDQGSRIGVSRGFTLDLFEGDGRFERTIRLPFDAERWVASADGRTALGVRPGAAAVVRVDLVTGEARLLDDVPPAIFDLSLARSAATEPTERLLLAASDAVWSRSSGASRTAIDGIPGASAIAPTGSAASSSGYWTLGLDGRLRQLDGSLAVLGAWPTPAGSWGITTLRDPELGAGVTPFGVQTAAGRFLGGDPKQAQVAAITGSQLVLLDVDTGAELWRARFGEEVPRALAAADLDGDGRDELVLATQKRLLLFRGRPTS